MARAGLGAAADAVHADLLGDLANEVEGGERSCLDAAGHRHWMTSGSRLNLNHAATDPDRALRYWSGHMGYSHGSERAPIAQSG